MIRILVGELDDGQWFAHALQISVINATRAAAIAALRDELSNLKLADIPIKSIDEETIEL